MIGVAILTKGDAWFAREVWCWFVIDDQGFNTQAIPRGGFRGRPKSRHE